MKGREIKNFLERNKKFSLLWASQILSVTTTNVVSFTMATKIFTATGSTLAVSLLWIFYFLPAIFLGPFSGYFVDVWNKRKILIFTNVSQALIVLLFLLVKDYSYHPIYSIIFLYSLADEFYVPAESSSIPRLVRKEDLPIANGLFMFTSQMAMIIGFGVGGILIRIFGKNFPVFLCSLSLFLAAAACSFLPRDKSMAKKVRGFSRFWAEIKAGYSFIVNRRVILFPIVLIMFFNMFTVFLGVSLPSFATRILGIAVEDSGPLLIVPLGMGALAGTLLVAKYAKTIRKKVLMKRGFLLAFLILLVLSLGLPYLKILKAPIAFFLMFFLGIAGFFIFVPNQTLLQENVPVFLRGRTFGTMGFVNTIFALPFLLFSGTIVDAVGVDIFMFLASLIVLFALLFLDKAEELIIQEKNGNF